MSIILDGTNGITTSGNVAAANGSTGGYFSSTYATNAVNNIWSFGNATNYGLKYFQGTSGTSSTDTIALPFGQTTSSASFFQFISNGSNLGALVMPNQPKFYASLTNNGDQTYTNATLPFNIVQFNQGGGTFNTSSYSYTAPIGGYYYFAATTYGTSSAGSATMYHTFYVNGSAVTVPRMNSDVYIGGSAGQINIAPISAHMIYSLNKGDVVTVFASAYNASAVYRVYTGQSAFFGYLIG